MEQLLIENKKKSIKSQLTEIKFLQLIPDMSKGFQLIKDWEPVELNIHEINAYQIFLKGSNTFDSAEILEAHNPDYLISYLRYDLKKVLIRARYMYIDSFISSKKNKLTMKKVSCGFYEPLLISLCFAETIGQYTNSEKQAIATTLNSLGQGYKKHSRTIIKYFRNGLAHHFRPFGKFFIDLNSDIKYCPPYKFSIGSKEGVIIDLPHLFDSLIIYLEDYIKALQTEDYLKLIFKYKRYIERRKLIEAKMDFEEKKFKYGLQHQKVRDSLEILMKQFDVLGKKREKKWYNRYVKKIKIKFMKKKAKKRTTSE